MSADPGHFKDDAGRVLVPGEDGRVLVIGAGGMLGRAVTATLSAHGINWVGVGRGVMDLSDPSSLRRGAEDWVPRDGVVINCAAWTDVDGAEKDEAGARAANATGPGVLAELCRGRGAVLVHFSTDYVFGGDGGGEATARPANAGPEGARRSPGASAPGGGAIDLAPGGRTMGGRSGDLVRPPGESGDRGGLPGAEAPGNDRAPSGREARAIARLPWRVDDSIAPVNAYGRTKADGERAIAASGCERLIIRTSWLHAAWGKNFVRTIAGLCLTKPQIKVVDDQVGRPTCCWHLGSATVSLLRRGGRGVVHVTDGGEATSWCGFAREIARHVERRWGKACEVAACTSAEFPRPAKRPAFSVLDLSSAEGLIGARPDWRVGVSEVMGTLERPV